MLAAPQEPPLTVRPAKISAKQNARGPDIYRTPGRSPVRSTPSAPSSKQPDSGGPLLAADGQVYGVIFAAALATGYTGYALTADEVA